MKCFDHVEPDKEAQPSRDDQQHGYDVHGEIALIGDQAVRPENVDPRIAEGGDRSKHSLTCALQEPILRDQDQAVQKSARSLDKQCSPDNPFREPGYSLHVVQIQVVPDEYTGTQPQPFMQPRHDSCPQDHDTQAADLDQKKDDHFSKQAPVREGVNDNQTGHADTGCRSEQCREKRTPFS